MKVSRPHSLQGRLILSLLLSLMVTLGSTALLSYFITQHEADEIFNARLATSARVFDVLVARKVATATLNHPIVLELPKELELEQGSDVSTSGHRYENKIAFQVWSDDGQLLVRSASAPDEAFAKLAPGYSDSTRDGRHWQVFTLASGSTWVQVAEHDDIREEMANELSFSLITPLLAGSILLLALSYGIVRVGLRSLAQLASDIGGRGPESLSAIELSQAPREVSTVAFAMNQLLTRLRSSREREIRFTDAAAHELKTPLAALRVHADNLRKAQTADQQQQSLQQLLKSLDRAQRLSEQLLALSAVQAEGRKEEVTDIPVAEWVADVVGEHEPAMEKKHQTFEAVGLENADRMQLKGQPLKLHRLLSNLLDNAIRYGDVDSVITLTITSHQDSLELQLVNRGEPIPPAMRASILEPYVRVLGSKSEGTGLGLAIVKEIVDQHDGQLRVDSDAQTRENSVTVTLRACAVS